MKNPKVTFVMPSINDEFIKQAIKSVMLQSFEAWELLIFNNKEGRKLVVPEDERIQVIDTDGWNVMRCFNEAHKIAKSDIILHQGDDDMSATDRALLSYYYLNSEATLFAGGYVSFSGKGKPKNICCPRVFNEDQFKVGSNLVPLCSSAYKISAAPEYREDFPLLHDFVFMMDFIRSGKLNLDISSTLLLYYRQHGQSLTKYKDTQEGMAACRDEIMRMRELYNDDTIREKYLEYMDSKTPVEVMA